METKGCCVECGAWLALRGGVVETHNNNLSTPVRYCAGSLKPPGATYTPVSARSDRPRYRGRR